MKLGLLPLLVVAMVSLAGAKEAKLTLQNHGVAPAKVPAVTWNGKWSVAGEGGTHMAWNRSVQLKNTTTKDVIAEVYSFVGQTPTPQFIEACARRATKAVDLKPGETVATGVWCTEDPAADPGARVLLFTCSSRELSRLLERRAKDPQSVALPFAVVSP
jgi:hypothetical protein